MDSRNLLSSLIFAVLTAVVMMISWDMGIGSLSNPQAGFMPFWISLLMLVFSLVLFAEALLNKSMMVRLKNLWREVYWRKTVAACACLAVYIFVLPAAGYLIATGILMLLLFRLNSMKIWTSALVAVLSVGFTYGLFHLLIKTPLPRGIWGF
jgi:putative tricarboxylic transport membrane protein